MSSAADGSREPPEPGSDGVPAIHRVVALAARDLGVLAAWLVFMELLPLVVISLIPLFGTIIWFVGLWYPHDETPVRTRFHRWAFNYWCDLKRRAAS